MHYLMHFPFSSRHPLLLTSRMPVAVMAVVLSLTMAVSADAQEIAISNTETLSFGSFVAGTGGTVTVSPGGARNATGAMLLVPSSQGIAAALP